MKKISLISISLLLILLGAIVSYRHYNPKTQDQLTPILESVTPIANPLDDRSVRSTIKNPAAVTRCLLIGKDYANEYFFNKDNILLKSTNDSQKHIITYTLKYGNQVYNWSNQSNTGTVFSIPTTEQLRSNPNLQEYLHSTPNSYQFDEESIIELKSEGYQVGCEVVEHSLQSLEPPNIPFNFLLLDSSIEPTSLSQPSAPQP